MTVIERVMWVGIGGPMLNLAPGMPLILDSGTRGAAIALLVSEVLIAVALAISARSVWDAETVVAVEHALV